MPPHFTATLATHLERDAGRPCREATDGEKILPGTTLVAPGDFHMIIDKADNHMIVRLNKDPQEHFCRPSVNPLFRSAATWYNNTTLSVILTGMGNDGSEGCREIHARQGRIIAQDQQSCVVWGMPRLPTEEGLAEQVLPLSEIASTIIRHTNR